MIRLLTLKLLLRKAQDLYHLQTVLDQSENFRRQKLHNRALVALCQ